MLPFVLSRPLDQAPANPLPAISPIGIDAVAAKPITVLIDLQLLSP